MWPWKKTRPENAWQRQSWHELTMSAEQWTPGAGVQVEATRRLVASTTFQAWVMIALTAVILFCTAVLVYVGVWPMLNGGSP